ncbi:MAG: hypothetical protein AAGD96_20685 [Chloroflexota bacterium]
MKKYATVNWAELKNGYRSPYSPIEAFKKLEDDIHLGEAWSELQNELHHQGDVDSASYACVEFIVDIYLSQRAFNWNPYALVAKIEDCRGKGKNPNIRMDLKASYLSSIEKLSMRAVNEISECTEPWQFASLASIVAMQGGFLGWAHILSNYDQDTIIDFINGEI